jgi:hypothetical protein
MLFCLRCQEGLLLHAMVQDAGKKQVAAILGVQAARAATQPRPFLKLARQHLAVQARLPALPWSQCAHAQTSHG